MSIFSLFQHLFFFNLKFHSSAVSADANWSACCQVTLTARTVTVLSSSQNVVVPFVEMKMPASCWEFLYEPCQPSGNKKWSCAEDLIELTLCIFFFLQMSFLWVICCILSTSKVMSHIEGSSRSAFSLWTSYIRHQWSARGMKASFVWLGRSKR